MKRLLFYILLILIITTISVSAQEIGASWEFNEDGNSEGWEINRSLSDLAVTDGLLTATISGYQASFAGPESLNIAANEHGFVYLRMQVADGMWGRLSWKTDSGKSEAILFDIVGDSLFHEYEIPVHSSDDWIDNITTISKLQIQAPNGADIRIDYIRIQSIGVRFDIHTLKPLRTVCKKSDQIPLVAKVKNTGDTNCPDYTAELILPEDIMLLSGESVIESNQLEHDEEHVFMWTIQSDVCSDYTIEFRLTIPSNGQEVSKFLNITVTDSFWVYDKFIINAYNFSPSSNEETWAKYKDANFESVLNAPANAASVDAVAQHGMRCLLRIQTSDILHPQYFPWSSMVPPPDITEEVLSNLDPIIEQFKDNPAVFGYEICDEPYDPVFPNLQKTVAYLRDRDPERMAYINLNSSRAVLSNIGETHDEHLEKYLDTVRPEFVSFDCYPFEESGDRKDYFNNLEHHRKWALRYDLPLQNILQLISDQVDAGLGDRFQDQTPGMLRWNLYTSLAYGCKAISYWTWGRWDWESDEGSEVYQAVKEQNRELTVIGPVLMKLTSTAVYHTDRAISVDQHRWSEGIIKLLPEGELVHSISDGRNFLIGLFKDSTDADYLMLVNKDYNNEVTATITLNRAVTMLKSFNVSTGDWEDVPFQNCDEGIQFEQTFLAGGGILYQIGEATGVATKDDKKKPGTIRLSQNYPNPFNPSTTIQYSLPQTTNVKLTVFDVIGREIAVLVNEKQNAGDHRIIWNAQNIPSGLYLYRFKAGSVVQNRKMLLLK